MLGLLLALSCKGDPPADDTGPDDTSPVADTDDTQDTADSGEPSHTLQWEFRPDPGLVAPTAAALRAGAGSWEALTETSGETTWTGADDSYELAVACEPEDDGQVWLVVRTVSEMPVVRLACPQLDAKQQVGVEVTVEALSEGQTALVTLGSEGLSATADSPSGELRPVAGTLDASLAISGDAATGRTTYGLALSRGLTVDGGPVMLSADDAGDSATEIVSAPTLKLNDKDQGVSSTVSLWTAGGTVAELGWGATGEVGWGNPGEAALVDGDRLLLRAEGPGTWGAQLSVVQSPDTALTLPTADVQATLTATPAEAGLEISISHEGCGQLAWMDGIVAMPGDTAGVTWHVWLQPDRDADSMTYTLPRAADIPGFSVGWDPTDHPAIGGGIVAIAGGAEPTPEEEAAALVLRTAGTGSGLVGPAELLGYAGDLAVLALMEQATLTR